MKKEYLFVMIVIVSALFASCNSNRRADILENNSKKINKTCPVRIDSLEVLDSTSYNRDSNTMTYFYSVSGSLDDSTFINDNYDKLKESLQDAVDNSVEMIKFKEYEVNIVHRYTSSSTKRVLATFNLQMKQEKEK